MKLLREFDAGEQHIYLVAGDGFAPTDTIDDLWGSQAMNLQRNRVTATKDRYTIRERKGLGGVKVLKDLQWVDANQLDEQVIGTLQKLLVNAKRAGASCEARWLRGDSSQLAQLYQEIVGKPYKHVPPSGRKLARQMVRRTAEALQFENVGIKPYVMYGDEDRGYVRRKNPVGLVSSENVDAIYNTLSAAKRWYKRQWYQADREDHWVRDPQQRSNPLASGIVHFRVVGFLDHPRANPLELLFTYIHEVSHAWADTVDNLEYNPQGIGDLGMYIRKWVSGDPKQIRERIEADPVKLFASADFAAYAVLRMADMIQPEFLQRTDWRD